MYNPLTINKMSVSKITIETELLNLIEVLEKTGNPTVAVQILDGTYQEPKFCKEDRASVPDRDGNRKQCVFISYDKWTDIVEYRSDNYYSSDMPRENWEKLALWADVLDSQAHETPEKSKLDLEKML